MHHTFSSNFYATTATVIPVLYLALTVQGPLLPGLLSRLHRSLELISKPGKDKQARERRVIALLGGAYVLMTAAALIVAAGVAGEVIALIALERAHDSPLTRAIVLSSVVGLLLVTAAGPLWALNTAWVRLQWIPLRTAWRALHHRPAAGLADARPGPGEGDLAAGDGGTAEPNSPTTAPT